MPDSLNVTFPDSDLDWVPPFETGYNATVAAEDTSENYAAAGYADFPDKYWIEPGDWEDAARQCDKYKTWPDDYSNRFTNQSPTHECTCHSLLQCCEIAWNRQRGSKEDAVWFSAIGVYAEANPRIRGGASMRGVLNIAMRRGMVPEHDGPDGPGTQKVKFKWTVPGTAGRGNATQSSGSWVPMRDYPDDYENTSKHFKPLEVINVRTWEQHFCLLLHGIAIHNGRSGHSIPHVKAVKRDGVWYSQYKDSYDVYRYDSIRAVKSGAGSAFGIVTMTRPDDWNRPAGADMK